MAAEKMTTITSKFMTSKWLQRQLQQDSQNVVFSCGYSGNDLQIVFQSDTSEFEQLFRALVFQPSPKVIFSSLVIKCRVGLEHTGSQNTTISFLIGNNGGSAVGFQLTYGLALSNRPYRSIEGNSGRTLTEILQSQEGNTLRNNKLSGYPRFYDMTFYLSKDKAVGICSSSLDEGHSIITTYSKRPKLGQDLFLQVHRESPTASYTLNFVQVAVNTLG